MLVADRRGLTDAVDALGSISLAEIDASVSLQTRVDRKYVVPVGRVAAIVESAIRTYAALEIDGSRCFDYESWYFDTVDHESYRSAATARRHRFKVRTRVYRATESSVLEVKTRGRRGETVKQRIAYRRDDRHSITADGAAFIDDTLGRSIACDLQIAVSTEYARMTLAGLSDLSRVTIDTVLAIAAPGGERSRFFDHVAIIETKTGGAPAAFDRALWQVGIRPSRISKFAVAMALTNPDLPANRWTRVLRHGLASPTGVNSTVAGFR